MNQLPVSASALVSFPVSFSKVLLSRQLVVHSFPSPAESTISQPLILDPASSACLELSFLDSTEGQATVRYIRSVQSKAEYRARKWESM